jgi:DNA sulfur modification protein DndD
MLLEEITLKDFRCFNGEHTLEFSTDEERNVTLIHAENGVGKTTLLNAMLWCFYGVTTAKFERKFDLVNHDAAAAGRDVCHVEVVFEHDDSRYRARRYGGRGLHGDRIFSIMRIDDGHSVSIDAPDTFINTVIPKTMAGHFLFDGEHAEVFLGEENRAGIRRAVQDILGCNLIDTAIEDLEEASAHYRRQMPKAKASASAEAISRAIDDLEAQIGAAKTAHAQLKDQTATVEQQIADIDGKLRDSSAAKALQESRERVERERGRALKRASDAQDEVVRWLGDNGRFIVSTRVTETTLDELATQETKGKLPSPYNEEFVQDLLDIGVCICGTELCGGSVEHAKVASLLEKAANHVLRSRLTGVRAVLNQLKSERTKAPAKLDAANKRLAAAREEVSAAEVQLGEISARLSGIDFGEIAERERRRNELKTQLTAMNQKIGAMSNGISSSEASKVQKEKDLRKLVETDDEARIFVQRHGFCEALKARLERELRDEEEEARKMLRMQIGKVLGSTTRKLFRLKMTDEYAVSLINEEGTQLPKSSGENQLLGLAFTAALVEFARLREKAGDHRLLRGTVAPLVLDSPFGQLDDSYRRTTGEHVPRMARQVVLMVSGSQATGGAVEALKDRVEKEYVLVRTNKAAARPGAGETRQFRGRDVKTAIFDQPADGTLIVEVA